MLFRQFVDDDLGCASYLIGDETSGSALVVDPAYSIERYLGEAGRHGVRIERVLETHTHADHVSGHGRLALELAASVHIHSAGEPRYPFEPLEDGAVVESGAVALHVLHTPGHRPEHCSFAVADRTRSDEPWLVLTGDSLFVGDVGRADLAVDARDGARDLFASLRRLFELGDGVEVYPGHVAGSLCGLGMSGKASSTIGFERRWNRLFALGELDAFVADAAAATTPRPPNSDRIVELNRGPFLGAPAPLEPAADGVGAAIVDVRPPEVFAGGHAHGALNVPVSGSSFATKAGFVLSSADSIVIHAGSLDEVEQAARGLRSVGLLDLAGYVLGPPAAERFDPVDLDELELLLAADAVEVVDVRESDERDGGYIAGSRHIPYRLVGAFGDELGQEKPVVTICESGGRATIAASVLAAAGVAARPVLSGGVGTWQARGGQTVSFRRCGT